MHAHTAHPSQERRGTSGARAQTHTRPDAPARSGGARHQPRPNHTPPHSTPNQGVQETTRDGHTSTHTPNTSQGVAGRSRNPDPSTHAHTAHQNRERVQAERAHNHAHPITLTTKGGVQAATQAQPQTPQTPASKRGATPQTVPKHTHPRPQPGLGGVTETHTQPQPGPKHKRHTTVGNPVSIARALRQPVPCR